MSAEETSTTQDNRHHTCLEEKNKKLFTVFKYLGIFLIKWDKKRDIYVVQPVRFFIYYIFWFSWPLSGLGFAFLGRKFFSDSEKQDHIDDAIESSLFILGFAVVPAIKTYCIRLITKYLPDILEDIASLSKIEIGFQTPLDIHICRRTRKSLSLKTSGLKNTLLDKKHEKLIIVLPAITVLLSIVAFIGAWTSGVIKVVEWSDIKKEWPLFTIQFTYLTLPFITTWFSVTFIEWLRTVYESLRVEYEHYYYYMIKSLWNTEQTSPMFTFNEENVKVLRDYIDLLQDIFSGLSDGFIKLIMGINFFISLVSSICCSVKLLEGSQQILYIIPLSVVLFHLAVACYKSSCLREEYEKLLLVLKKLLHLEWRNPGLLPFRELQQVRENLSESPPQIVIFAGYPVGNGLIIGVIGFIVSYAVLANEVREELNN
ncbi:hypothetical protein SK128_009470 [Halocaridina rubra]|uniref:Uncharacterized protein n=1 Tax=Halocaridina rubra TaxID=373956 RepID=A0AAN8WUD8_HALRR